MRLDLLVDQKLIIEVKASEKEHAVHKAQVLTYLRLNPVDALSWLRSVLKCTRFFEIT